MPILQKILDFFGIKSDLHRLLLKNTVFLLTSEIIAKAFTVVLVIFLARYLGTMGYGELQFAFAFSALFQFALDLGFNGLLVREIAGNPSLMRKYTSNVLSIKTILAVLCYGILSLLVFFMHKPIHIKWLVLLAGVHLMFLAFFEYCSAVFQAFEKLHVRAYVRLLYSALLAVTCGIVIWNKGSVNQIMYAYIFSAGVSFVVAMLVLQLKFTRVFFGFQFRFWKSIIIQMIPFALIAIVATVYNRVDMVMLSFMKGEAAVGVYAAAYNVYAGIQVLPLLGISAAYASLSRLFKENRKKFEILCKHYFWLMVGSGFVIGSFFIIFANPVAYYVFGERFIPSGPVLQILGACFMTGTVLFFMSYFFSVTRMQSLYVRVLFMALLLNIGLNYVMISKIGPMGAAIATFIAQAYQIAMLLIISYFKGFRVWKS